LDSPESSATILARVSSAPLPKVYEHAKTALAACWELDECAEWANKADALRSYARQSRDDQLEKLCMRIKARAIRRCGELMKEIDRPEQGGRPPKNGTAVDTVSVREVAENAGLSKRQQVTAVRVARVPASIFEDEVEGDDPPTVTELARQGTRSRPQPSPETTNAATQKDFDATTAALGAVGKIHSFCQSADWDAARRGASAHELATLTQQAVEASEMLGRAHERLAGNDDLSEFRNLQTSAFAAAWAAWKKHRREKRVKLTPSSVKRQLAHCAQVGPDRAAEEIYRAIQSGWTGFGFEKSELERKHNDGNGRTGRKQNVIQERLRL
jgi:hypothetical protein